MLRYGEQYVPANYRRVLSRDLRFLDALDLEVSVPEAEPVEIAVDGLFRYSDRRPMTQPQWEDYLEMWDQYLQKPRQPMAFEVWVDGKPAGKLDRIREEQREVALNVERRSVGDKPKTAKEEVAVTVGGMVNLPLGTHRLRFIPTNIVDGLFDRIRLGITREVAEARETEIKANGPGSKK